MTRAYLGESPALVAQAYDFAPASTVVDCGGGVGTQLIEVLRAHQDVRGVLLDTPRVIEQASSTPTPAQVSERLTAVAGDFFTAVPAGGDYYMLSHIVHDWDDDHAVRILDNCRAAAAPRARFLLVEELIPDGDELSVVKMLDVVLSSVFNGGERTLAEVDALLTSAGLTRTRVIATGTSVSLVEAVAQSQGAAQ